MWRQYIPENISLESIIEQAAAYVNESCRDERATAALLKAVPFAALCASLEGHAERRALRETDVDEDDADGCDDEETRILVRAIESVVQQALESAALSEQVPVSSLLDWVALGLHSRHTEVRLTAARMLRMPLEAAAATVDGKQAASSRVCEEVLNRFGAPPCSPSLTGSGTLGCVAMMNQCGARPSGIDQNGVGSTDTPEGDVLVPLLRVLRDDRSTEVASTAAACLLALVRARPNRGAYALLCDPRGRAILLEQMLDGEAGAIALVRAAQLVLCLAGVSEFAATAARQILQEVLQQRIERWDGVAAAADDDDILLRLNLLEALGEFVAQLPSGSELLDELGLFGMLRERYLQPFVQQLAAEGREVVNGDGRGEDAPLLPLWIGAILRFYAMAAMAQRSLFHDWIDHNLVEVLGALITVLGADMTATGSSAGGLASPPPPSPPPSSIDGVRRETLLENAVSTVGALATSDHGMDILFTDMDTLRAALRLCVYAPSTSVRVAALHALRRFLSCDPPCWAAEATHLSASCGGDVDGRQQRVLDALADACQLPHRDGPSPLQVILDIARHPFEEEQLAALAVFQTLMSSRFGLRAAAELPGLVDMLCQVADASSSSSSSVVVVVVDAKRAVARAAIEQHAVEGERVFGTARWSRLVELAQRPPQGGTVGPSVQRPQPVVDIATMQMGMG
ncbi:hypothetical protein CDCA_CDCA11G3210 [Cyanidium caldarium]|uniref:Uncharacterized protein n=1 Tax=Cyanidium caldarium TaxID=2771 RepID=A0AAV9IXX8_CYACA|nr:hypothetical protein CDCA_CDCA11G3210 [Cyanidium caldarium]